jgi:hypothetical protein
VRLLRWLETAGPAGEAVLVPWAYREDCRPVAWTGRLEWIPADTRGAFTGWLRPREHWLGGVPTFDVEMAWREPVWAQDEPRWSAGPGVRRMTPEEFILLYSALPTEDRWKRHPREEAARVRGWARDRPAVARLAPATTMLANLERAAAEQERHALAGRWTAEVRVQESRDLPLPIKASAARGQLVLEPVAPAPAFEGTEPEAVYRGKSTLDFTALGFRLHSDEVLVAVAHDGIRLILDPTVDHGHVVAAVSGGEDELAGTWYLNSRPARARGSIALHRVR